MTRLRTLLSASVLTALLLAPAASVADDDDDDKPSIKVGAVAVASADHDSAQASGTVRGERGTLQWWFEYGSTYADAQATPRQTVPGTGASVQVKAELTKLKPSTVHYVRLVAQQSGTRKATPLVAFTTADAPAPAPAPADPSPSPSPSPGPPAVPDAGSEPVLGETVVAAPAGGEVRVRLPGADGFVALGLAGAVPVGAVVDATAGRVRLHADTGSGTQRGTFGGGRFLLRQRADGYVDLHLRGGGLHRCGHRSLAATAAGKRKRGRKLWGRDRGGRFRTHGRDSVATVRGTRWSMTDRCGGTLTKVSEGAVDVRVRRTGKIVRVPAGDRHFAPHR